MDKLFEANSIFHAEYRTAGTVQYLFYSSFLVVLAKFLFLGWGWALGYSSIKFWDFSVSLNFLRSLSLVVLQLVRQLTYTIFITNNRVSFHLWWNENLVKHRKVSKYYNHDCLQNSPLLFMSLWTAQVVKSSQILAGIYFIFFLKKHPIPNLDLSEQIKIK